MEAIVILSIIVLAFWYLTASLIGRWYNARVAQRCCEARRRLGDAASLYMDLICDGLKIGLYIRRPPWDNPLNLVAFYILRRKPFVIARFEVDVDLGVMDASRAGSGERVGPYYFNNTSTPRAIARDLLKIAESVDAWRISTAGRRVQVMWEGTDCRKAVDGVRIIVTRLRELNK